LKRYKLRTSRAIGPPTAAFTIVELLVVIGLMAVISGLVFGVVGPVISGHKREVTHLLINRVDTALNDYKVSFGSFPEDVENSEDPTNDSKTDQANAAAAQVLLDSGEAGDNIVYEGSTPYIQDTYGQKIRIITGGFNQPGADIWSEGPDGENDYNSSDPTDHGDDIVNWTRR
jgi:type II secretory pathway pseudopilin PulG